MTPEAMPLVPAAEPPWSGPTEPWAGKSAGVWSEIVYSRQKCLRLGKSRLGESQFVAWVGATCARWAHPVSSLGQFHLSAQRLHPSAQQQAVPEGPGGRSARSFATFGIVPITLSAVGELAIWRLDTRVQGPPQVSQNRTDLLHSRQRARSAIRLLTADWPPHRLAENGRSGRQ